MPKKAGMQKKIEQARLEEEASPGIFGDETV